MAVKAGKTPPAFKPYKSKVAKGSGKSKLALALATFSRKGKFAKAK